MNVILRSWFNNYKIYLISSAKVKTIFHPRKKKVLKDVKCVKLFFTDFSGSNMFYVWKEKNIHYFDCKIKTLFLNEQKNDIYFKAELAF